VRVAKKRERREGKASDFDEQFKKINETKE
jgi:hypothetical protein